MLIIIITEQTQSKNILEITVEIEPQPAALDFKEPTTNGMIFTLTFHIFCLLHDQAKPQHFLPLLL